MIPSLFPNDLERLSPGALSLLFKTWILRSLSIYVRDCLDVVGYDAAGSLVRTNLRNTSPAEFDCCVPHPSRDLGAWKSAG